MAQSPNKRIVLYLLAGAFLAAGVWFGWQASRTTASAPLDIAGIYLPEAKPIASFKLQDSERQPFTQAQLKDQWTFLYFGYTYCPDACPLALAQLNQVSKLLQQEEAAEDTAYMLVSVDPRRDTPERLAEYTEFFNPEFAGTTGAVDEIDKLTRSIGIYYAVPAEPEDPENYLVDHSSVIVLTNPDGKLQALFSAPHNPKQIYNDYLAIRTHNRS